SGETLDYGPCAFLDAYDPATVFSSIDHRGRYAYGNQPAIGQWNMVRLAIALAPLDSSPEEAYQRLGELAAQAFTDAYDETWLQGMRRKLGLPGDDDGDSELIRDFLR